MDNSCDEEDEDTRMAEHIVRSCLLLRYYVHRVRR